MKRGFDQEASLSNLLRNYTVFVPYFRLFNKIVTISKISPICVTTPEQLSARFDEPRPPVGLAARGARGWPNNQTMKLGRACYHCLTTHNRILRSDGVNLLFFTQKLLELQAILWSITAALSFLAGKILFYCLDIMWSGSRVAVKPTGTNIGLYCQKIRKKLKIIFLHKFSTVFIYWWQFYAFLVERKTRISINLNSEVGRDFFYSKNFFKFIYGHN